MSIQHTYRIRHKGIESTPYSLADLRQMWKTGKIDHTTAFRRGDSEVWLEANDLWAELNLGGSGPPEKAVTSLQPTGATKPGIPGGELVPLAPTSVRVVSIRIPFHEVFVLVAKFFLSALLVALGGAIAWAAIAHFSR